MSTFASDHAPVRLANKAPPMQAAMHAPNESPHDFPHR
jgi:hypothetical protein